MAADLFETYGVTAVATMLLGGLLYHGKFIFIAYPLILGAISIIASIIGTLFVSMGRGGCIMGALYRGLLVAAGGARGGVIAGPLVVDGGGDLGRFDLAAGTLVWGRVISI